MFVGVKENSLSGKDLGHREKEKQRGETTSLVCLMSQQTVTSIDTLYERPLIPLSVTVIKRRLSQCTHASHTRFSHDTDTGRHRRKVKGHFPSVINTVAECEVMGNDQTFKSTYGKASPHKSARTQRGLSRPLCVGKKLQKLENLGQTKQRNGNRAVRKKRKEREREEKERREKKKLGEESRVCLLAPNEKQFI